MLHRPSQADELIVRGSLLRRRNWWFTKIIYSKGTERICRRRFLWWSNRGLIKIISPKWQTDLELQEQISWSSWWFETIGTKGIERILVAAFGSSPNTPNGSAELHQIQPTKRTTSLFRLCTKASEWINWSSSSGGFSIIIEIIKRMFLIWRDRSRGHFTALIQPLLFEIAVPHA